MTFIKKKILTLLLCATMLFSAVGFSACGNGEQAEKLAELELKLLQQQTQIADIVQEKEDLAEQLTAQIENLEEENEDLQSAINALEQQNEDLKEVTEGQSSQILELQQKNEDLQAELEEQKQENESLKKFNQSLIPTEGKLLSLKEAYACGLLTIEDLLSIAYYNNYNKNTDNQEIMPEDFVPQEIFPEELSEEIAQSIREAWYNKFKETYPNSNATLDSSQIEKYYGTYNGCVVALMNECNLGGAFVMAAYIVFGVTFRFPTPYYKDNIVVWKL